MDELRAGDVLGGRYEILEQLGAGGMARVYRAHDPRLGRDVAIKVLSSRYAADPTFVERFRREASAAAGLNHPNIVQVFDRGEAGDTYYIVMEHLPGPDLKSLLRRRGPLPPLEAIDDAQQILAALGAAHRNDVIHRDVKPQNVILAQDGTLKVTDFGIARAGAYADVTEAGSIIGTAQYLSPEQARGGEVTPASDCYAAGIVLYEMLTGRVPFDGDRPVTIAMKQINEPPVAPRAYEPDIPEALEAVVLRALNKRPSERFRSAEEFSAALQGVRATMDGSAGQTVPLTAVTAGGTAEYTRVMEAPEDLTGATRVRPSRNGGARPLPSPPRRSGTPFVVALLVLLGLLAVGGYALLSGRGGDTVRVPADLVGMTPGDAAAELSGVDLRSRTETVVSDAADKGKVVGTDPPGGDEVDKGTEVLLQVGAGPATKPVTDVVDMVRVDAEAALVRDGFQPRVEEAFDPDVEKGRVISQSPKGGEQLAEGGNVTITVSKGPETVKVPDVQRLQRADAEALIRKAGLVPKVVEVPNTQFDPGTVVRQNPGPTASAKPDSTVTIEVATTPEPLGVPGVIGLDKEAARAKLEDQGFDVATEGVADAAPVGQVIDQRPAEGERVTPGTTVTLVYSEGLGTTTTPGSGPAPPVGGTTPSVPLPAPTP